MGVDRGAGRGRGDEDIHIDEDEPAVAAPPVQPAGEAAAPIVEAAAPADDRRHAQGGGRSRGHTLGGRGRRSK